MQRCACRVCALAGLSWARGWRVFAAAAAAAGGGWRGGGCVWRGGCLRCVRVEERRLQPQQRQAVGRIPGHEGGELQGLRKGRG